MTPPASHPPAPLKSRHFLCTMWPAGFELANSPSCVISSTTAPHSHLCLYYIFFPHRLYWTECKLLVLGPKRIQIKNLSTTMFHNFLRSTTFILVVFPFEIVYEIWISLCRVPDLRHTAKPGYLPCALIWHMANDGFVVCQRKAHDKFFLYQ